MYRIKRSIHVYGKVHQILYFVLTKILRLSLYQVLFCNGIATVLVCSIHTVCVCKREGGERE